MAGRTLKSLISRRRRVEDGGEDDEGPVAMEDSQSEASDVSGPGDEEAEDGDGSSVADPGFGEAQKAEAKPPANGAKAKKARKSRKKAAANEKNAREGAQPLPQPQSTFKAVADTEAMMNGLKINDSEEPQAEALDFESMPANGTDSTFAAAPSNGQSLSTAERQRRSHEEYRRKRDADPAFIPNRGNFFMHDTRGQANGQAPPQRGAWQGRGRGRGAANVGGPFSPANQMDVAKRAAEQPWKHDLHETVNEEASEGQDAGSSALVPSHQPQTTAKRLFPKEAAPPTQGQPSVISFDSTTLVGKVQIRLCLPGMKASITFSEAPVRKYVRLPQHRPPLRRDKPVRVLISGHTQRYIFPATDRSFIFIPRQMRPNQQGFHRGGYQRSIGGYGYSSRRSSMYGASMYSGSVAPSRRSSLAGASRDHAFSPVGSMVGMPSNRPVVRLPHGSQHFSASSTPLGPMSGQHTPTMGVHTYPLPQQPHFQGTPTTTVHQPRPQKAISVTGMESPAVLQQVPGEPPPFQNQLPAHMSEQVAYQQQPPPQYFSPRQQYHYPGSQPQTGTPLSGIPEGAMQPQSFQPQAYGQSQYYQSYPPQQGYYYPPPGANGYSQMPMYMMPPQGYMMQGQPGQAPPQQQAPAQQRSESSSGDQQQPPNQSSQSGMVAHESNGMVFYVPASEAQQSEQYQPAESFVPSYAMPGLPPPTPAPDNQMPYYYPPGMQEVGTAMYYPAQQ